MNERSNGTLGVGLGPTQNLGPSGVLAMAGLAEQLGYSSLWLAEVAGTEAFSLLGAASQVAPGLDLGTGVVGFAHRSPPLLAMAAATLQSMAPDREVLIGVGPSSPAVASWHGVSYPKQPVAQLAEFLALLRACLSGDRVDFSGHFYEVRRFRLGVELGERRPKVVLAALGPQMLRLGGRLADGVLLGRLPVSHVAWSVEQVRAGGPARVYAYVYLGLGGDGSLERARRDLLSYMSADAYAAHFARAGFPTVVAQARESFARGERAEALGAIPREMVEQIYPMAAPDELRRRLAAYREAGVEEPVILPLPWGSQEDRPTETLLEALAPRGPAGA